ncbi:MAG: DNA translocase FtsK [Clostridia bacterium]
MANGGNRIKLDRKKILLIKAIVLVALIIVSVITPTRNALIGVFGYLFYAYFGILVVFFIADLIVKGKWKKIETKRIVIFWVWALFSMITIHITVLGKEIVNSGFATYIADVYYKTSVGGVILSLISAPIVLPCKYLVSSLIFFFGAMITGFLCIYPYIFVSKKSKNAKLIKKENNSKDIDLEKLQSLPKVIPSKNDKLANDIELEKQKSLEREKENNKVVEEIDRKKEALKKLYGDNYVSKSSNLTQRDTVIVDDMPKITKEDDYSLIGGYHAYKIKPVDDVYSDNARIYNQQQRREEASKKLGLHDVELQQKIAREEAFGNNDASFTKEEAIKQDLKINDYKPTQTTIYDDETVVEKEEYKNSNKGFYDIGINTIIEDEEKEVEYKNDTEDVEKNSNDFYDIEKFDEDKMYDDTSSNKVIKKPKPKNIKEILEVKQSKPYVFPNKDMLKDHSNPNFVPYVDNVEELRELIEVKLKNYNIDAKYIDAIKGPTITTCLASLSDTCSISRVMSAKQDINRLLRTNKEINILPQIEGSPYFAIEIPNKIRGMISFKEIICSKEYMNYKGDLVIAMGKTTDGKNLIDDLAEMPHALVAGSTGSGKSVCLNCILASLLFRYSPDELKLVLVDLKKVEMALFSGLPHMLVEKPLYEIDEIINTLKWLEKESDRRYTAFESLHVKKLSEYNSKVEPNNKLPRIVVIIDEASELITNPIARKPVEASLSSLARVARAAGIHLIFATQNPVKEVITNEIQNNLNTKIAFAVGDYNHSMVIFKTKGAEKLLGKGDMFIRKGGKSMVRAQCAYISGEEIDALVAEIRENNDVDFDYDAIERILHGSKEEIKSNTYSDGSVSGISIDKNEIINDKWEDTLKEALALCYKHNKASGSLVQRKLNKGSNTTTNIMETLEKRGWVSEVKNNKRTFLRTAEEFYKEYPEYEEDNLGDDRI